MTNIESNRIFVKVSKNKKKTTTTHVYLIQINKTSSRTRRFSSTTLSSTPITPSILPPAKVMFMVSRLPFPPLLRTLLPLPFHLLAVLTAGNINGSNATHSLLRQQIVFEFLVWSHFAPITFALMLDGECGPVAVFQFEFVQEALEGFALESARLAAGDVFRFCIETFAAFSAARAARWTAFLFRFRHNDAGLQEILVEKWLIKHDNFERNEKLTFWLL